VCQLKRCPAVGSFDLAALVDFQFAHEQDWHGGAVVLSAQSRSGRLEQINIDKSPDQCPICLRGIQPVDTGQRWVNPNTWVEIVFRCPREECDRYFIARYQFWPSRNRYDFQEAVPLTVQTSKTDDTISKISPDFVSVYRESQEADLRNLKLVCGPGYRKALEFLIKDYIIKLNPGKAEEIKKLFLGKCISDFVKNDKINKIAERAVWLGNDETHYLRKWEGKDLQDLKNLISLTVHWIEMEELTEATIKDMPEPK
jgi:hypothetical protein